MGKRNEITNEYLYAISEFSSKLNEIDTKHGTYVEMDINNVEVTVHGDLIKHFERVILIKSLDMV